MIDVKEAEQIHSILIDRFGGTKGVRDEGLLSSALNRPFSTFDNQDLYPSIIDKAAALVESIVVNHPFVDGNKRIGYVLMRLTLLKSGYDIDANQNEKYIFILSISKGEMDFEEIKDWIEGRVKKIQ
jgi:death-on-curing protein